MKQQWEKQTFEFLKRAPVTPPDNTRPRSKVFRLESLITLFRNNYYIIYIQLSHYFDRTITLSHYNCHIEIQMLHYLNKTVTQAVDIAASSQSLTWLVGELGLSWQAGAAV